MARKKELSEEERKKELIRKLKKGPDLEKYLEGRKRTFVSYAQGARMETEAACTAIGLLTAQWNRKWKNLNTGKVFLFLKRFLI